MHVLVCFVECGSFSPSNSLVVLSLPLYIIMHKYYLVNKKKEISVRWLTENKLLQLSHTKDGTNVTYRLDNNNKYIVWIIVNFFLRRRKYSKKGNTCIWNNGSNCSGAGPPRTTHKYNLSWAHKIKCSWGSPQTNSCLKWETKLGWALNSCWRVKNPVHVSD